MVVCSCLEEEGERWGVEEREGACTDDERDGGWDGMVRSVVISSHKGAGGRKLIGRGDADKTANLPLPRIYERCGGEGGGGVGGWKLCINDVVEAILLIEFVGDKHATQRTSRGVIQHTASHRRGRRSEVVVVADEAVMTSRGCLTTICTTITQCRPCPFEICVCTRTMRSGTKTQKDERLTGVDINPLLLASDGDVCRYFLIHPLYLCA